ncbi:MAG: DNA mismatch repair endonuclease MutL, partial [Lachnospiraceae bacterium]|nr:DNA mismatch repair endonuclease MutL [Lachnospiraceae bacterium]
IYSVYGRDICSNVIEINESALDMSLTGYVGKPIISRGNRNNMIYFINGRYIKSKIIYSAIEEAYKPYLMQHNYPFCILHFEIDSHLIDVNVHPSKMEIRFENSMDVYNFFFHAVRNAISQRELIPEVLDSAASEDKSGKKSVEAKRKTADKPPEPFEINRLSAEQKTENNPAEPSKVRETSVYGETITKQNPEKEMLNLEIQDKNSFDEVIKSEENPVLYAEEAKEMSLNERQVSEAKQMDLFDNRFLSEKERVKHKMIGQLFDTYWLIEYDNHLYIIDQHAAHEKVLYEKTMNQLKNKDFTSQQLNPPIILTLTMAEAELLEQFMDNFTELGYEIESFGGKEYAVRAVPDNLYSIGSEELLMSLIDNLSENSANIKSDLITEKIASMSCKAAVKGNNRLSFEEANALIEQLLSLDNPYNCPHGRPTIISMSKYEIEKKFKRIL